jgi:hypothetical protein
MAQNENLPEATDNVGTLSPQSGVGGSTLATADPSDIATAPSGKAESMKADAIDRAKKAATAGKDKASDALDGVVRFVDDAARSIDEKVGENYGAYARRAAEVVGGFASSLRARDVEELFDDARAAVRRNPVIAIGAAAAVGFIFVRLVQSGLSSAQGNAPAAPDVGPLA